MDFSLYPFSIQVIFALSTGQHFSDIEYLGRFPMLNKLHIENFTVFRKADLEFSSGLNVITGDKVNFHSKCKMLGGVAEFFSEAFLCRFPPEDLPRPVVYPVHSLPV